MMKAEQLCRFRVGKGYRFFAKSSGIQPAQEEAMGRIFNDKMNELFPDLGYSFLCCAQGDSDVFLARNTLLTSETRKSMFTHAYVFSKEEYARAMQTDPMAILGVKMQSMLDNDAISPDMPTVDLPSTAQVEPIEVLFEKYKLDKERYSRLLFASYVALLRGIPLQLVTTLPYSQTPAMLREMILCILDGLLPCLKGKISFSTGPDAGRTVSVFSTAEKSRVTGKLLFGIEDEKRTNISFGKELIPETVFNSLAEMSHEERTQAVAKMQAWLEGVTDVQRGISLPLVCVAFYMTCGKALDAETRVNLFSIIAEAKTITPETTNRILADIVAKACEAGEGISAEYNKISNYYLSERSNGDFCKQADFLFEKAPIEECMVTAEKVFAQTMTERSHALIQVLADRIPVSDSGLKTELRGNLIRWIMTQNRQDFAALAKDLLQADEKKELNLRGKLISWMLEKNEASCTGYAIELLGGCKKEEYLSLAMEILNSAVQQDLTAAQKAALAESLAYMTREKMSMDENYGAMLDTHCMAYTEELRDAALEYLFLVRFPAIGEKASLALLLNLEKKYPSYANMIIKVLESGENPLLWENYRTKKLFVDGLDPNQILKRMRENNTFDNPMGPMEQKVMEIWLQLAREEFSNPALTRKTVFSDFDPNKVIDYSDLFTARWYEGTKRMNASDELKERITAELVDLFWEKITPEMIYINKEMIDRALLVPSEKHENKMTLFAICLQVRGQGNQKSCRDFVDDITNPETKPEQLEILQECAEKMFYVLMEERQDILWDLLLCRCWRVTEKGAAPDLKEFVEQCRKLDEKLEQLKAEKGKDLDITFDAAASVLLEDEALKKAICKLDGKSFVLDALIDDIKPERKGLFGRKKSEPKDGEEKESKKKEKKDKKHKHRDGGDGSDSDVSIIG